MSVRPAGAALRPEWLAEGKEVAVVGLARSGLAVSRLLLRAGASVYASDGGSGPALERAAAELRGAGAAVDVGRHDLERIARASLVVASPGVPPDAAPLRAAREHGVPVAAEVEIALRFLPELRYIAITGTNGKTTTTAVAGRLLSALGHRAVAAGNIGVPLSELAMAEQPPEWAALELSSFQLHDMPSVAPVVGVLTNLSPNHLDRYDSVAAYYADKALMFRNATAASRWVWNADDAEVRRMVAGVPGTHRSFSLAGEADAWWDRTTGELVLLGAPVARRDELPLLGDHNVANALAALLAVAVADDAHRGERAAAAMASALRGVEALEHRIEPVGEVGGVQWINDSKSTNVASTLVALRGMRAPTVLLLGGRHKGDPYTPLADELRRTVREVVAYGEAGPIIEADLAGVVPLTRLSSSFEDVVAHARRVARAGDVVLLSPACSSFDMFENYEARGRAFKTLVRRTAGAAS